MIIVDCGEMLMVADERFARFEKLARLHSLKWLQVNTDYCRQ